MARIRNDLTIYHRHVNAWWDPSDPFFSPLRNLASIRHEYIRQIVDAVDGMDVLDIGCGGGYMMEPLAMAGGRVWGIDPARGALIAARRRARERGYRVQTARACGERLPFPAACFDLVVCTDVLVHVASPRKVVCEVARVLRPGGLFFFSAINRTPLARLVMITLAEDLLRWIHRGTHDPRRFIRPDELEEMCLDAGLEIREIRGIMPTSFSFGRGLTYRLSGSSRLIYLGCAWRGGLSGVA